MRGTMTCVLILTVMLVRLVSLKSWGDVLNKTESSLDIEGVIAKAVDIFHV